MSNGKGRLLVVGGAGFIGSHVNYQLCEAGYETVVFDNLSRGHKGAVVRGELICGDLGDSKALDRAMEGKGFDAVLHFAACTDVGASRVNPALYYRNNVCCSLALLEAMVRHSIKCIVFSSSAAIFGLPYTLTLAEDHPCLPISPYGRGKWMVEQLLQDFQEAYGLHFCALRYFNAAGGDPKGMVKSFERDEHNLIPRLLRSIKAGRGEAVLYGGDYSTPDGSCIRDYVHVMDLGRAHVAALEKLLAGGNSISYNLGNGQGFSVKEVIASVERVTQSCLKLSIVERRQGDPPRLVANGAKAERELGWKPHYTSLDSIVEHAWLAMA